MELIINQQKVQLTITKKTNGTCFKCQSRKEIRIISHRKIWIGTTPTTEVRKFCWACALDNLYQLEQDDYQITNKNQIIQELRQQLTSYDK